MENGLLDKLTIAIPVYNDEKHLRQAVESCLGQAGRILICDNASTDGTAGIAAKLAEQHPCVTHIRHAGNIGAFENFKKSLFDCTTEYFCWIGSHDALDDGYSRHILDAMENNKRASLGAGTIVYIDENGNRTGKISKSGWAAKTSGKPPLDRAGICAAEINDCFLFYAILRTECAKKSWFDSPGLGFDRAFICKMAAEGEILYVPKAVFLARETPKNENKNGDAVSIRLAKIAGEKKDMTSAKNLFPRNMSMVRTVLDLAQNDSDLGRALDYLDRINKRYPSRKKHQRRRLLLIAAILALLAAAGACLFKPA